MSDIPTAPVVVDEEYQDAIQPVVDNNMRTDILGPHFCRILKDHKPASKDIVALIAEEIAADPKLKSAIKTVIDERNGETKMRWFDKAVGAFFTIILALVIWGVQYFITHPSTSAPASVTEQNSTKQPASPVPNK